LARTTIKRRIFLPTAKMAHAAERLELN
jgi:hypothetical protein